MSDLTLNKLVPIMSVVKSAIIDVWGNIEQLQELYSHWAKRELDQLQTQTLKRGKRYCFLNVNENTNTATLPLDFEEELEVCVVRNGIKYPLRVNTKIINSRYVEQPEECVDKCPKCNQDKAICEELQITETINLKVINGHTYNETVIKKLYPNGDYYLETSTPVLNINSSPNIVEYVTDKQFINHLDLKDCGCLDTTPSNLTKLEQCCPAVYSCYYGACDCNCVTDYGGYKVFEENGLIQFDLGHKFTQVYIEYLGYIPKRNGTFYVPKVAFEAMVEGVKYRAIKDRKNVTGIEKKMKKDERDQERRNLTKILTRVSLASIIESATSVPQFNSHVPSWYDTFNRCQSQAVTA